MVLTGGETKRISVLLPLLQILRALDWVQTQFSAVKGRRITTC